jgi:YD repeat-containing protein
VAATVVRTEKILLTGLVQGIRSKSVFIDVNGAQKIKTVAVDRANAMRSEATLHPDSNVPSQLVYVNGLKAFERIKAGIVYAFSYDAATGRKASETDALGNTTLYSYDAQGRILRSEVSRLILTRLPERILKRFGEVTSRYQRRPFSRRNLALDMFCSKRTF